MKIFQSSSAMDTVEKLDPAWDQEETFVFVNEKAGVTPGWLEHACALVPADLHAGHFILLTSGSTGEPKLVVGSKARAEKMAQVIHQFQELEPVAAAIAVLPLTYCYSFVNQWLWARVLKRELIMTDGFSAPHKVGEAFECTERSQICLVKALVPLLKNHFANCVFRGIIRLNFAGGRFPQEDLGFLAAMFPNAEIFNNYGCTEAMPRLTVRKADRAVSPNELGTPLPGIEMRTAPSGELEFRSPYAAIGAVIAGRFERLEPGNWIATGDMGVVDADGRCRLLGRSSEVFKRNGEKISLFILQETVSKAWPGGCGFYRELDRNGEEAHIMVLAPHPKEDELSNILQAIRRAHPRAYWPIRIESVESLPFLPNNKVDSQKLQDIPSKNTYWKNPY